MMKLTAVVAMSRNRVIGVNNQLPWHLPEDLKKFRQITTGHPIIMGRKTFESIGRILPNREHFIISRNPDYRVMGATVVPSLNEALALCQSKTDETFIIGGMQIYLMALPKLDRIYLTLIQQDFKGDAFFPEFELAGFKETAREDHLHEPLPFSFLRYDRERTP